MKIKSFLVTASIGLILLAILTLLVINPLSRGINMAEQVSDQTLTGANAIQNYEWFKSQEERINNLYRKEKTAEDQIVQLKKDYGADPTKYPPDIREQLTRLNQDLAGIRYRTDDAIADYNSRSRMANRSIFKDLPTNVIRGVNQSIKFNYGDNR